MRGEPRRPAALALGAVAVAIGIASLDAACAKGAGPAPAPASKSRVGQECAECHSGYVDGYRRTGMARALGPIEPGEFDGLGAVNDGDSGFRYRLGQDGGGSFVVESFHAAASSWERRLPLAFAIGAGILDRSYVARDGSRIAFAPLEVLSATETAPRHADLAPGHAIRPGLRFGTGITEECLACHTDSLPERGYPLALAPDLAGSAGFEPRGISCGACHPSATEHAAWQERAARGTRPQAPDPIASPPPRGSIERLSLCARCHLQGDARILLEPGARGVPAPGGDLLGAMAVFVDAEPSDAIAFVSHVERMVLSPCFERAAESALPRMECTSCHDPHVSVFEADGRREARAGCVRCHAAGDGPSPGRERPCALPGPRRGDAACSSCHMRRTGVFDVATVAIHDHRIARVPPPPSPATALRLKGSEGGRVRPFRWPGAPMPSWADDPGIEMMGRLAAGHAGAAAALVDAAPGAFASRLATYQHLRGTILESAGRREDAERAYRSALALDPAAAESAVNLGPLLGNLGRASEGVGVLDRVVEAHPLADGALRNRALLKLQMGDEAGFVADLEAAFRIQPNAPSARALAQIHGQRGDSARARLWTAEAARLDPPARPHR